VTRLRMLLVVLIGLIGGLATPRAAAYADTWAYDAWAPSPMVGGATPLLETPSPQVRGRSIGRIERSASTWDTSSAPVSALNATEAADPITGPVTPAEAKALAEAMGYVKTNFRSHGQPVYKKGKSYISRDVDGHCGGVWKEASSPEDLASKTTRNGTYNADLTERLGD
jgi:hypothetical protein